MLWHELSWPDFRKLDRDTPVVVPLGSCEQHGHHLPVGVDTFQVDAIAAAVEAKSRDKLLLVQTLWLGSSHHHLDFPGTISLIPSLYSQVIRGIAETILASGFRRIFFLNGHGGNRVPAAQALTELIATNDDAEAALIGLANWWEVARDAVASTGFTQPCIAHACEVETSLMLAIRKDLVHTGRVTREDPAIVNKWFNSAFDVDKKVAIFHRFHRITAAGSLGDPQRATADKGHILLNGVVDQVSEFVLDFSKWTMPRTLGPQDRTRPPGK
jgi:creatinine amidohydrolase